MDAHQLLGVAPDAGEEEIRAAYLQKVKEHPPDRSPEAFERIRDAYGTLRDPRRRVREMLEFDAWTPFRTVFGNAQPERRFTGPEPWIEALKGK